MEFDKSRVYTALNADELKVGDKVILADNLQELIRSVNEDLAIEELSEIRDISYNYRFKGVNVFNLAYLVEKAEEKKWRPFKDIQELIDAWAIKTGITARTNTMPLIWIVSKNNNAVRSITGFEGQFVLFANYEVSYENLLDYYTFLDGTPCGKEIEE